MRASPRERRPTSAMPARGDVTARAAGEVSGSGCPRFFPGGWPWSRFALLARRLARRSLRGPVDTRLWGHRSAPPPPPFRLGGQDPFPAAFVGPDREGIAPRVDRARLHLRGRGRQRGGLLLLGPVAGGHRGTRRRGGARPRARAAAALQRAHQRGRGADACGRGGRVHVPGGGNAAAGVAQLGREPLGRARGRPRRRRGERRRAGQGGHPCRRGGPGGSGPHRLPQGGRGGPRRRRDPTLHRGGAAEPVATPHDRRARAPDRTRAKPGRRSCSRGSPRGGTGWSGARSSTGCSRWSEGRSQPPRHERLQPVSRSRMLQGAVPAWNSATGCRRPEGATTGPGPSSNGRRSRGCSSARPRTTSCWGLADSLSRSTRGYESPLYFATVERAGEVQGCAFRTPPYKLGLTRMPVEAASLVASDVAEVYDSLPAVLGPLDVARRVGDAWAALKGVPVRPLHRPRDTRPPTASIGAIGYRSHLRT